MRINRTETNLPIKDKLNKNNKYHSTQSFKGLIPVDKFCLGLSNTIENGGLAVSFMLQDFSVIFSRTFWGLKRNKDENHGEVNMRFAAKECVRESLSGPSMFIIPGGILAGAKALYGKACSVPSRFINAFGNIFSNQPVKNGKIADKQDFYKETFTEIIKNAKNEETATEKTLEQAENFAKRLNNSSKEKLKETIEALNDDFVNISKSHAKDTAHTEFTMAKVAPDVVSSFKTTVSHMLSFGDDVVKKAQNIPQEKVQEFIKQLSTKKTVGRFALNLTMYSSLLAFLQVIPKLYNKAGGEKNAGLKGLMDEETFHDVALNKRENTKHKNGSIPSFGSMATMAEKITGKGKIGKFADIAEFDGCNVSFPFLLGIMGFGILGPRIYNAQDKYDLSEIMRRDFITCAVMCFAEKELRKAFSKLNEIKSGLVLASKEKGFYDKPLYKRIFDYLRPIEGVKVLTTDQIRSRYTNIEKYNGGIKGFCDFVSNQGGNLSKLFSLTKKSKNIVGSMLEQAGHNIENADNKTVTDVLSSKTEEELKPLFDLFKDKDNEWVKKARTLNARFTAVSILVLVPIFLGIMLPVINEHSTKKQIRKEQAEKAARKAAAMYANSEQNNPIFSNMIKYVKN